MGAFLIAGTRFIKCFLTVRYLQRLEQAQQLMGAQGVELAQLLPMTALTLQPMNYQKTLSTI